MNNYEAIIKTFRDEIDSLDDEIIELFVKRFQVVKEIGKIKKENDVQTLDEKRWEALLLKLKKKAEIAGLDERFVEEIWDRVHKESLSYQGSI